MLIAFVVFSLVVFCVGLYALTRVITAQHAHESASDDDAVRARRRRRLLLTARLAEQEAARIERERKHPPIKNFPAKWIRAYMQDNKGSKKTQKQYKKLRQKHREDYKRLRAFLSDPNNDIVRRRHA